MAPEGESWDFLISLGFLRILAGFGVGLGWICVDSRLGFGCGLGSVGSALIWAHIY